MARKEKTKKGFKEYLRLLVLTVCLCVFIYSGYQLITIYLDQKAIDTQNDELRDEFVKKTETGKYLDINWEELLQKNGETIAWIVIPDTKIDYPIVDGNDNDKYLRHDIELNYLNAGTLFVEENHEAPFAEPNTIIYGHNMLMNSMFGELPNYMEKDFADEHPYIYVYLPQKQEDGSIKDTLNIYRVVSAHKVNSSDQPEFYNTPLTSLDEFYPLVMQDNVLGNDFKQDGQPMIMLSTCADGGSLTDPNRIIVHAVLEQEGIDPLQ